MSDWKPFGDEPLSGVYWVGGVYPETDVDVDDHGQTVGWHTGQAIPYVALVDIDYEPGPDGIFAVTPVNEYECGRWDEEYVITHYMEFEAPAAPNAEEAA